MVFSQIRKSCKSSPSQRHSQNRKKNSISISVFDYENKEKHSIYESKKCCEESMLIYINQRRRIKRVLIKDFHTSMYDHTLHCGKKRFCCYCLQAFSTEEILKNHIKDCFKINGKQRITMPKRSIC